MKSCGSDLTFEKNGVFGYARIQSEWNRKNTIGFVFGGESMNWMDVFCV